MTVSLNDVILTSSKSLKASTVCHHCVRHWRVCVTGSPRHQCLISVRCDIVAVITVVTLLLLCCCRHNRLLAASNHCIAVANSNSNTARQQRLSSSHLEASFQPDSKPVPTPAHPTINLEAEWKHPLFQILPKEAPILPTILLNRRMWTSER